MPAVPVAEGEVRHIRRPTKSYSFRCFIYVKSGLYVAECIDLDLMVKAKTEERAFRGLEDAMRGYLKTAFEVGDLTGLIPHWKQRIIEGVEPIPKIPKPQFDAVLSKLLSASPLPLANIRKKHERKPARPSKQ